MTKILLEVKGLKKHFPIVSGVLRRQVGAVKAVDGIDWELREGESLGLVGESGSGKSTAARAAIRLIEPTSGSIRFLGRELSSMGRGELIEFRKSVQIVFQDPYASLNPRKTIGESIGEALFYHRIASDRQEVKKEVERTLERVGLRPDQFGRYPHELSGGQQQRVCIARAVILRPKLLLCDEAVSSLDLSVRAQILNLLLDLKGEFNLSYLFISHDLSLVRYFCERVLVLKEGKIVERGSAEELFRRPSHPYTRELLDSLPKISLV